MSDTKTPPKWLMNVMIFGGLFLFVLVLRALSVVAGNVSEPVRGQQTSDTETEEPSEEPQSIRDECTEGILTCSIDEGYYLLTMGIEARTDHFYAQAQESGNARQYLAQQFLVNKQLLEKAQTRYGSFGGDATQVAYVRDRLGDTVAILAAFEKINLGKQPLGQGVAVTQFMVQADEIEQMLIAEFPVLAKQREMVHFDVIQERSLGRVEVAQNEPE